MMNDPNQYGSRVEASISMAVIGALAGWIGGAELALYWFTGRAYGAGVLWQIITTWGLTPARWGALGYLPAVTAFMTAGGLGTATWRFLTIPGERHVRGHILHRDPKAIARALKPSRAEPAGVLIHPAVQIEEKIEVRHTLLVGGSGGGKTTILWPLIQQARARGDKVLLFDSKGDFTEKLAGDFTLLSPTDSRSARWAIGHDIRTPLDAQALAETLIPSAPGGDKEPMWINGSRALLAGVITDIQRQKGVKWGMSDLAKAASVALADFETLKAIITREDPAMLSLLGGEEAVAASRTTMGFLVQVATSLRQVINLGVAARDLNTTKNPAWAVRSWLAGEVPPVAVIGFRDSARALSQAWGASIIEQVVRQVSDMPDAHPHERRIWLIVDEAPRIGKVPSITDALTTARSKGVRVVLGIQSLAQIREVYARETATTWAGQTATKIICQTTAPEDQKWCCDLLGEREVERYQHQLSQQYSSDQGGQHSASWQRVREPVLLPASFGQELRVLKTGPRALLMSAGEAAVLDWPFPTLTKHRVAYSEARWTQPGYVRPIWGKSPPDVAAPPSLAGTGKPKPENGKKSERHIVTVTPAPATTDLPVIPISKAPSKPDPITDHVVDAVIDHIALPGAAMAAKILGMATNAAPTPTTGPQGPTITTTKGQGQGQEDERDGEERGSE